MQIRRVSLAFDNAGSLYGATTYGWLNFGLRGRRLWHGVQIDAFRRQLD